MNMTMATTVLPNILSVFQNFTHRYQCKSPNSGPNVVEKVFSGEVEFGIATHNLSREDQF